MRASTSRPTSPQGFTNNIDLLTQGIHKLRPGGGTALFDALYKTCHDQMLTLRDTIAVRRALVLVSDGDDNYSRALQSDAIKECQRAETIVYAISTNVSPSKDKGDEVLNQIATATGGQAFYPVRIEDVPPASTTSRKNCAASTRSSNPRRTSRTMVRSGRSTCRRMTRATRFGPKKATSPARPEIQ